MKQIWDAEKERKKNEMTVRWAQCAGPPGGEGGRLKPSWNFAGSMQISPCGNAMRKYRKEFMKECMQIDAGSMHEKNA